MAPLVILVEFRVKPHFAERFGKLISANAKASVEREPGCQRFDVLVGPEDPRRFWLYEIYDDDAAFDHHLQSRHFKVFTEAIEGQIEERALWRLGFHCGTPKIGKARKTTGGKAKGRSKTETQTKRKMRGKAK
jgi:(4S)-4-hydroxy-5-phosphonooxypentane-2,3-dione isomerase